jgi:hypothetical protein
MAEIKRSSVRLQILGISSEFLGLSIPCSYIKIPIELFIEVQAF